MKFKIDIPAKENRTSAQIIEHYVIEKELAEKLRHSSHFDRQQNHLYTQLYNELYQRVSHHSQLTRQLTDSIQTIQNKQIRGIADFLKPETVFLEVGAGRCSFSFAVAQQVQKVYAVDVSTEITKDLVIPHNVEIIICDGCNIPVAAESIDTAYSHQLMEHLHPDDAVEQLQSIYKALKPGGVYICITPHRLSGPHDISKYFDEVATGFHLKEYKIYELCQLFKKAGFSQVFLSKTSDYQTLRIPLIFGILQMIALFEFLVSQMPFKLRRWVAEKSLIFRSITLVGVR